MVPASVRPFARVGALALAGVGVAFAWILLAVVIGFGSSGAHAADDSAEGGLLGSVTGVVGDTVDSVAGSVSSVVTATSEAVVQPVTETVVSVAPPVAPVVETVSQTAAVVTDPVVEIVDSGVATEVVAPVVDVVAATPVVGAIVSDTGADTAVTDLSAIIDKGAAVIVGAADHAATTLPTSPATPGAVVPGGDSLSPVWSLITRLLPASATASATPALLVAPATVRPASIFSSMSSAVAAPATSIPATSENAPAGHGGGLSDMSLPGPAAPSGGSITGPGGAGPGAAALLAFGPLVAHRAWMRRRGWEDDEVPAAPAGSTDVSPD